MTRAEMEAFNAGIALVAGLAAQSAAAMRARETKKPTRYPFAAEALQAIADEASGLMRPTSAAAPKCPVDVPSKADRMEGA